MLTEGGSGCSIISDSNTSYGMPFDEQGGGAFAMLWDGSGIKICRLMLLSGLWSGIDAWESAEAQKNCLAYTNYGLVADRRELESRSDT